jgi:hypothetical protein
MSDELRTLVDAICGHWRALLREGPSALLDDASGAGGWQ